MKAYPIWHDVTACNYSSDKSWGSKDTSNEKILVGSSASNSYQLAEVITTKRLIDDQIIFRTSVDGIIMKEAIFENNHGKAGKYIKTRSALKRMKGL